MNPLADVELEWGVAQACCADRSVVSAVLARVRPEDFSDAGTRLAMAEVAALHARGEIADKALVARVLRSSDSDAALKLFDTRYELPVPAAAPGHARHLRALAMLRRVRALGGDLHELSESDDPGEVIAHSLELLRAAGHELPNEELLIADLVDETLASMDADAAGGTIPTGIPRLDRSLDGGLKPTRLYVVGARPSVGKSALVTNWVRRTLDAGTGVYFVSLEMTGSEVLQRLAVEAFNIREVTNTPGYAKAVVEAIHTDAVAAWPLHYAGNVTIGRLITRARELRADGIGLIVLDYLQLLPSSRAHESRALEVGAFTRALKLMAMELQVPVVAVSQLNRQVASRKPQGDGPARPVLTDLRESGAIEQDANVVMLMHRDVDRNAPETELIICKNRHGRTGTIDLVMDRQRLRFAEEFKAVS